MGKSNHIIRIWLCCMTLCLYSCSQYANMADIESIIKIPVSGKLIYETEDEFWNINGKGYKLVVYGMLTPDYFEQNARNLQSFHIMHH